MYTTDRFTGAKLLKSGLKLIGGKTKTRDILYQYRPKDCTRYIEPFLGSGAILCGIEPKFEYELVSDINDAVIEFFQDLQSNPSALFWLIKDLVGCVENRPDGMIWKYYRDHEEDFTSTEDIPWHSGWFYIITKYAMNGIYRRNKSGKCNSSWCKTVKGRGIYTEHWFGAVHERVKNVVFKCQDYKLSLMKATPETWVICDSPYSDNQTVYNADRWGHDRFKEYVQFLNACQGKVLVTINDTEFIRSLFKGWQIVEAEYFYSCSQTRSGRGLNKELIIMNY